MWRVETFPSPKAWEKTRWGLGDSKGIDFLKAAKALFPHVKEKLHAVLLGNIFWWNQDLKIPASQWNPLFYTPVFEKVFFCENHLLPQERKKTENAHMAFLNAFQSFLKTYSLSPHASPSHYTPHTPTDFTINVFEKSFLHGVTDVSAQTLSETFSLISPSSLPDLQIHSGKILFLWSTDLSEKETNALMKLFLNPLIETGKHISYASFLKKDRFSNQALKTLFPPPQKKTTAPPYQTFSLTHCSDTKLKTLSETQLWALSLPEMKTIQSYFQKESVQKKREAQGLPSAPTDVEMEILAQSWSEHCKHKIFQAQVSYEEKATPLKEGKAWEPQVPWQKEAIPKTIHSLFQTTICFVTQTLAHPWLLSVFHDNAGIIDWDSDLALCLKVETHNSPSALDPYGGALTGILGVQRDILGCGIGAKPIAGLDVFCVAPLETHSVPSGLFPPRRILEGVVQGVADGGNKTGVPTICGALVVNSSYLGKPLVFCGMVGMLPKKVGNLACESKQVHPQDRVCMVGGRIGKDGIHGATFSSLALNEKTPSQVVQLGDPFTQKRMIDFLLKARDLGLYRTLTDNGAGGLSSSVGELAQLSQGASIDVGLAKTKYPGLSPFELVVSESQERMSVVVPSEKLESFLKLASTYQVEVSVLGQFQKSGAFEILFHGKKVASLDLEFLHQGVPQKKLSALWKGVPKGFEEEKRDWAKEVKKVLFQLLSHPNIASKRWIIQQYDHEVQGTSVIKPLRQSKESGYIKYFAPQDGGVCYPTVKQSEERFQGAFALGLGILPIYSQWDPFLMAALSLDEAVRNVVALGASFGTEKSKVVLCDNFCWPDPEEDTEKMGALVRACFGLRESALALKVPFISGKDSMKNDFHGKDQTISVTPTVLVTALGKVRNLKNAHGSSFQKKGDQIYVLGGPCFGKGFGLLGSVFSELKKKLFWDGKQEGLKLPVPSWQEAIRLYRILSGEKLISYLKSVHDLSEGGLLVALSEGIFEKPLGAKVTLPMGCNPWFWSFGEGFHGFLVTINELCVLDFEKALMQESVRFQKIGEVQSKKALQVHWGERHVVWDRKELFQAWENRSYWEGDQS